MLPYTKDVRETFTMREVFGCDGDESDGEGRG